MQPLKISTLPDLKVLYARATELMTTPYFQSANREAFGKLMDYIASNLLWEQVRHTIAIYPDNVEIGHEVCFDAGVIFIEGKEPLTPDGLAYQILRGGRWAVFRHVGPYDTLWQTWQTALHKWLPNSGEVMRDVTSFEIYIDDPSIVAPEELKTDIYVPIQ